MIWIILLILLWYYFHASFRFNYTKCATSVTHLLIRANANIKVSRSYWKYVPTRLTTLMLARSMQKHCAHIYTHIHTGKLQTSTHTHTNMKLVLKFASTPAAHTVRFTHTVSTQWHKQACPEDTEQPWCCSCETPPYSLSVELLFCHVFSPQASGPSGF